MAKHTEWMQTHTLDGDDVTKDERATNSTAKKKPTKECCVLENMRNSQATKHEPREKKNYVQPKTEIYPNGENNHKRLFAKNEI